MAQVFYFSTMPAPYLQISIFNIGIMTPVLVGVPPYQQPSFPHEQQHRYAYHDGVPGSFAQTSSTFDFRGQWQTPEPQWYQQQEAAHQQHEDQREFQPGPFAEPIHETPRTIEPEQAGRPPRCQAPQPEEQPREKEEQEPRQSCSYRNLPQPVQATKPVCEPSFTACNGIYIESIQKAASKSREYSQEELLESRSHPITNPGAHPQANMLYVPYPYESNGEEPRDDLHQPGSNGIILRCRHGYQSMDRLYISNPETGETIGKIIGQGYMPIVPEDGFDVLDRRTGLMLGLIYGRRADKETRGRKGGRQRNKSRGGRFRPY